MPSPFPGMDPFLEAHWGDVHASLIIYSRNQIQRQLPPGLVAGVEQYVSLELDDEVVRFRPDASILRSGTSGSAVATATLELDEADEPYIADEPETQRRIRIEDHEGRLVTTIEFLSSSNKRSAADRDLFHHKQIGLVSRGVNLVEVDLLMPGLWTVFVREDQIPKKYHAPYRICVVRATRPERPECYAAPLQKTLPRIRVPLRPTDRDIVLNLQDLITMAWEDGAFSRRIDYVHDELPPLAPEHAVWVAEQLSANGYPPHSRLEIVRMPASSPPGPVKISNLLVQVGDQVTANQNLLTVELVDDKAAFDLPYDGSGGVVEQVFVTIGQSVTRGSPLIGIRESNHGAKSL